MIDIDQLLVLVIGIGLGFFVQSVAGFAAALIALPVMLNALDLPHSIAVLSVYFFLFSCIQCYKNRQYIDRKLVLEMSVAIAIGVILGVFALKMGNPQSLKKALGVFILLYAVYTTFNRKKLPVVKWAGPVFGLIGGVFSGMFSTGGPLFVAFINNRISKPQVVRATIIGVLAVTDVMKIPVLIFSGLLTFDSVLIALYALPVFLLAVFLGQKVHDRINEKLLKQILTVLLLASGISLLVS